MTPKNFAPTYQNRLDFFILGLILLLAMIFVSEFMRPKTTLISDSANITYQREIQTSPELGN